MNEETEELTLEKREKEASMFKLRKEVEKSLRQETAPNNFSINALTNPSPRDLPIILISAWKGNSPITSPQTVTFESFLANYNNGGRPGGGDGVLDLDSGVFTCFTPGYYQVSLSAHGKAGPGYATNQVMYLYKNGMQLPESYWHLYAGSSLNDNISVVGSRIVVSCTSCKCLPESFQTKTHHFSRFSTWMQETLWS